jgi:hypothetical protein
MEKNQDSILHLLGDSLQQFLFMVTLGGRHKSLPSSMTSLFSFPVLSPFSFIYFYSLPFPLCSGFMKKKH